MGHPAAIARANLVRLVGQVIDYLQQRETFATSPQEDYDIIRADYRNRLFDAFIGYLSSGGSVARWQNAASRAISEDFSAAFYRGYTDAGGELPVDRDDDAWLSTRIPHEWHYLSELFKVLNEWRTSENFTEADVKAKAELWADSLDGVYTEGRLRGAKNKTLEFDGEDGDESCADCQGLKGTRHTIKWIRAHDMVPRPGNVNFECRGYKCQHFWKDPKTGERWTF